MENALYMLRLRQTSHHGILRSLALYLSIYICVCAYICRVNTDCSASSLGPEATLTFSVSAVNLAVVSGLASQTKRVSDAGIFALRFLAMG